MKGRNSFTKAQKMFISVLITKIYMQNNGVTKGSPLGPVLDNIFMVELERTIIPFLIDKIKLLETLH